MILLYGHWLAAAGFLADYLLGCHSEGRLLQPTALQLFCVVISMLLAVQMQDARYLSELSGSALSWRLFWHCLKLFVLAGSLTLMLLARLRWKLDLR
jgi:hypothetical protein